MKYLYLSLFLLAASSCNNAPKHYVCFNPFMLIQSIQVEVPSEGAKDQGRYLELTDPMGNKAIFPKSLCVEVKHAPESN